MGQSEIGNNGLTQYLHSIYPVLALELPLNMFLGRLGSQKLLWTVARSCSGHRQGGLLFQMRGRGSCCRPALHAELRKGRSEAFSAGSICCSPTVVPLSLNSCSGISPSIPFRFRDIGPAGLLSFCLLSLFVLVTLAFTGGSSSFLLIVSCSPFSLTPNSLSGNDLFPNNSELVTTSVSSEEEGECLGRAGTS